MAPSSSPEVEALRYPIGRFDPKAAVDRSDRRDILDTIAGAPARMREAVAGLSAAQLATPYRDGGWTVQQVVHHVPDSHLNAYIRFKWTLTEDVPLIKTYRQTEWAELADSRDTPIATSLDLLEALHVRWDRLLRAMSDADFARKLRHPEWGEIDLDVMTRLYAWHGRHHVAHIMGLRERRGW
ncbi:MAG: YfiT family bacillithiol transferase [Longimicrobiales bacterium]